MLDQFARTDPRNGRLPSDISQALVGLEAPMRSQVTKCLERVFEDTQDWDSSMLTGDGLPFEACFHSGKDTFYWTADPAFGKSGADQLGQILKIAADLGDAVTHPIVAELPRLDVPHRAGTWLGGRHDPGRPISCKIYTDWAHSAQCRAMFPDITLPDRLPNGAKPQLRGIGLGPGPTRSELYYRFDFATPRHMQHILDFAGLGARTGAVEREAADRAIRPLERCLEQSGFIASLSQDIPGGDITVTFYFFPRSFCGNDRVCRSNFLKILSQNNRDTGPYACATEPMAQRVHYNLYHGLIALTVTPNAMAWGVGVRPLSDNTFSEEPINFRGI